MNIIELFQKHKNRILDGHFILIDYDVFFDEINIGKNTRFVIDDTSEIVLLKKTIERVRIINQSARLYVCAYGNELVDKNGINFLYGDSIWIHGSISKEQLDHEFHDQSSLEPTRIELLDDSDDKYQIPILLFSLNGDVIDLSIYSNRYMIESTIILYWD